MIEGIKKSGQPANETSSNGSSKKKSKGEKFPTKVVVRKLPPSMISESFLENVSPLPDTDYINFAAADNSLFPYNFSRAYINFTNQEDLLIFTQKFDNYVFVDSKGHEYPAVVEFSPFQRIPKVRSSKKKDSKCGTIESDPHYMKFKERLQAEEEESENGKQNVFETTLPATASEKVTTTPLVDYLRFRRAEKKRIREEKKEERKKRELERRKAKDEMRKAKKVAAAPVQIEGTVVDEILSSSSSNLVSKEKDRNKEKESFGKKGAKELLKAMKVKEKVNFSAKEKEKGGKSYREERLRRLEQREELRKKNSKTSDLDNGLNQDSKDKDKKSDEVPSNDTTEDKFKKQINKVDSYQKNKRKEYEKRSNEPYKNGFKNKDAQIDKNSKKKIVIVSRPHNENLSVSENKENKAHCDKSGKRDGVKESEVKYDRQGAKPKSFKDGAQKVSGKDNAVSNEKEHDKKINSAQEHGAIPKRRKSVELQSRQSSSFVKKKKDNDDKTSKEESKPLVKETSESVVATSKPSSKKSVESSSESQSNAVHKRPDHDKRRSSKNDSSIRQSSLEEEKSSPPVSTGRRKSLESQDTSSSQTNDGPSKKDPRTERRIRNKDRPAMEIYRPGMGKFSRQRLEKVLGSSTERDTPSPSPSITSN